MIFIVVFSLIASAFADQSFHEAGVTKVLESLEQTVFQGNGYHSGVALGHKLYVQQLLQHDLKSPSLSGNADALKSAKIYLQNILASMVTQTVADQDTLDMIKMAFEHCTDAWTGHGTYVGPHNSAVGSASDSHIACRVAEQSLISTANSNCGTMAATAGTRTDEDTNDHPCASSITSSDLIGDVAGLLDTSAETFYNQWDAWFNVQRVHYTDTTLTAQAQTCQSSYDDWYAKNGMGSYLSNSCGDLQLRYEEAFCNREIQVIIRCQQNKECHTHYHNEYNETEKQIASDETQRLRDVAMVNYVICLLDQIANGTQNASAEDIDLACQHNLDGNDEVQAYDNTYGVNRTAIPTPEHTPDCANVQSDSTPENAATWHSHLVNQVAAGTSDGSAGVTFVGPFRQPTPGLCTTVLGYASRGPAYYIQVTDSDNNEYWHNESLVTK